MVRSVLQRDADPDGDSRRAWDVVWRMVLDAVLKESPPLPEGTVLDMAPEVRRFLREGQSQMDRLYPRGDGWKANREGNLQVWSELWARLVLPNGNSQWVHLSSKDNDAHAEVQLVEIVSGNQQIRSATVYLNASPCSGCSDALLRLLDSRSDLQLSLRFGSVFAHHGPNHREGLLRLWRRGVRLTVFGSRDWELVAAKQRQSGDASERQSVSRKRSASQDNSSSSSNNYNDDDKADNDGHLKKPRVR